MEMESPDMESPSVWHEFQFKALLDELVHAQECVDISNTYTMGYVVMGAAKKLSGSFGREITRRAVVEGILHLKDRLADFLWFLSLPGVTYDAAENSVIVTDEYWARGVKETWEMEAYRYGGQPMYKDLVRAFIRGKADEADFEWLLRSFEEEEGVYLSGDNPWPRNNIAMAVLYPDIPLKGL